MRNSCQWSPPHSLQLIRGVPRPLDFREDIAGGGGPDERFGLVVVRVNVFVDRADQIIDVVEAAATQGLVGQVPDEAFDHVEPRRSGGREVERQPQVLLRPAAPTHAYPAPDAAVAHVPPHPARSLSLV